MSSSFPRERVLEELHALREATQALHRRLELLIGEIDGESPTDPRIVEIARRAIAELRAKQRARTAQTSASTAARTAERLIGSRPSQKTPPPAPSPERNSERRPRAPRRQPS